MNRNKRTTKRIMKKSSKKNSYNSTVRRCTSCDVSEEQEQLVEVIIPPTIMNKTIYCVKCRDRIIDNSTQKDIAKKKERRDK